LIAECPVGDERRFKTKYAAVARIWSNVDMLGIQEIAAYHVQQDSLILINGKQTALGLSNVTEV
jgi:hypothetical protein